MQKVSAHTLVLAPRPAAPRSSAGSASAAPAVGSISQLLRRGGSPCSPRRLQTPRGLCQQRLGTEPAPRTQHPAPSAQHPAPCTPHPAPRTPSRPRPGAGSCRSGCSPARAASPLRWPSSDQGAGRVCFRQLPGFRRGGLASSKRPHKNQRDLKQLCYLRKNILEAVTSLP